MPRTRNPNSASTDAGKGDGDAQTGGERRIRDRKMVFYLDEETALALKILCFKKRMTLSDLLMPMIRNGLKELDGTA